MAVLGAFAFGTVLGWFLYFTNRYRKGDAQLRDVATLISVIGGGAITALFGDAKTALFGAYGLGLAVGFFAYLIMLIVLVRNSGGAFSWTWFLDGRRKRLDADEEIPAGTRPTVSPMTVHPSRDADAPHRPEAPHRPPGPTARPRVASASGPALASDIVDQRDLAIQATNEALRDIARRIGQTPDDAERAKLRAAQQELTDKLDDLIALRIRDILDSEEVRQALAKLQSITKDMKQGAAEMKDAADALASAAKIISLASKVIGIVLAVV